MKIKLFLISLIMLAFTYSGYCLKVATTLFPIADLISKIGKEKVDVVYLIKPGEDPHHFEPTIDDIKRLQGVSIYFAVDKRFDSFALKLAKKVLFLNDEIKSNNPHIWLSFENMKQIGKIVSQKLCELDNKGCGFYKENYDELLMEFNSLENRYKFDNVKVLECHPAWTKFLAEVGITSVGYIKKGREHEPGIKTLNRVINLAKKNGVKYIVCATNDKNKIFNKVANILNAKIIVLEPIGGYDGYTDIFKLFELNLNNLKKDINE
ncbi:zinc ABC transporter, substrate-binding protein [Deferribacter desulfuricans SSM1]|uniref:Zinc ABC transporter, substrate-binding protein n=1 Tax=Deferribacter desulfuricans (strain DSM 14783 / JCM 11476 / NBRC 101012 / SSM1) TaxID=639282 RepID=D3P9K1_DEFDS|nr:metal ABC transporter substrate-binding protein [Deferribacter desulfuricans]BAI81391.1 zinc ABC transporter, substrate-binding protein [Deferribacter desulfuricans SSM1]